jgi:integrase
MSLIRALLGSAQDEGLIVRNPAKSLRGLKETKRPARETIHRALTREETEAFFRAARDCGSWYLPLYSFLLNTGCRFGEAGALMEKDLRDGGIRIERTLTKTLDGHLTVGRDAKTGCSARMIPARREALDAIREQRRQNARQFGTDGGPIFRAPKGGLLGARCVGKDIDALCRAAGIERFTAHAFRDTFATRAVESGMQPKTLQEILGHADIGVTMNLYAHVMEDTKRTQMEAVRV